MSVKLGDLEFKAEDDDTQTSDCPRGYISIDKANALLRQRIEKCPAVYFDDLETMNADGYFEGNLRGPKKYHTHRARLVAIEEIGI